MQFNDVSITQLRQKLNLDNKCLSDNLLIYNDVIYTTDLFKYPFRMDALVVALCSEGGITARIDLKEYEITKNTLTLISSGIIQASHQRRDLRAHIIILSSDFLRDIHIDVKDVIPIYMHMKENPCMEILPEETEELIKYYNMIQAAVESKYEIYKEEIVSNLVQAFMYQFSNIITGHMPLASKTGSTAKNRRDVFFGKFMELLSQYHKTERSVGFYAEQLHITPKYLSSLIKEVSGKSAAQWIDDYVIVEAKNLLKFSDLSIQEISYQLNFSNQSFFGKFFKHHTGQSPREYKNS